MLLEEFDLDVKAASTLAEGRAALASFDPDVCLTDLQLPDGDGIDFIRDARAADARREIVVLTGHGSLDTAVEAMKAGAFDFLVKPLRPVQLEAVLERLRPAAAPPGQRRRPVEDAGRDRPFRGDGGRLARRCARRARSSRESRVRTRRS